MPETRNNLPAPHSHSRSQRALTLCPLPKGEGELVKKSGTLSPSLSRDAGEGELVKIYVKNWH